MTRHLRIESMASIKSHPTYSTQQSVKVLQLKLTALESSIAAICSANGTPGLSLGVLHQNQVIAYSNFGHRRLEGPSSLKTSEHTIYHIASVGKFITALAIANLVHDGLLSWDNPVQKYLDDDLHPDVEVNQKVTIRHCLIHATGLSAQNRLWLGERGRMNYPADQTFKCFQGLEILAPVGEKWLYNNWGYAVAGRLVEILTGKTWGFYLKEKIFDPLGMKDTVTDAQFMGDNVAMGYMTLADGRPVLNGRPHAGDDACQVGASGIQTSVHDLLLLYKELFTDEKKVLKSTPLLLEKQIDLGIRKTIDGNEQSYAMGLVRTQLPGVPSMNPTDQIVIGRSTAEGPGITRPLLLHQNGNYPGYTAAAFLIPETATAVVVLTNCVGKIEVAEIVGQMVVEAILNHGKLLIPNIDWVGDAHRDAAAYNQGWAELNSKMEAGMLDKTCELPLSNYVGKYYNNVGNWYMEIFLALDSNDAETASSDDQHLWMCMQGEKTESSQRYELKPYGSNVFSWFLTLDECVYRGRSPIRSLDFYLLKFKVELGVVTGLTWSHDSPIKDSLFSKK